MPLVAHPVRSLWGSQPRCARCVCEWLHRKWDGAEHSIPLQTSGINQSSPTAQPTFKSVCQSENDIPVLTKHVELTTLQNTSTVVTVPEPVFTIQLDMHVPEVTDSPNPEILENLHDFQNNEDDYPNVQILVNINLEHLTVPLSEYQNLDTASNNEILHSSPEQSYLPPQDIHFQFNHLPDNEDDNDYY